MLVRIICALLASAQAYIAWRTASALEENRLAILLPMAVIIWVAAYALQNLIEYFAVAAIRKNRLNEKYYEELGDHLVGAGLKYTIALGVLGGIGVFEIFSAPSDARDLNGNLIVGLLLGGAAISLFPFAVTPLWGPVVPNQSKKLLKEKPPEPDMTKFLLSRRAAKLLQQEADFTRRLEKLNTRDQQLTAAEAKLRQDQTALATAQSELAEGNKQLGLEAQERARKHQELLDFEANLNTRQEGIPALEQQALDRVKLRETEMREELKQVEAGLAAVKSGLETRARELDTRTGELDDLERERNTAHDQRVAALDERQGRIQTVEQENAFAFKQREQEFAALMVERSTALDQRSTELDLRAQALDTREQGLNSLEQERQTANANASRALDERAQALDTREQGLNSLEQERQTANADASRALDERAQALDTREQGLNSLEQERQTANSEASTALDQRRTQLDTRELEIRGEETRIGQAGQALTARIQQVEQELTTRVAQVTQDLSSRTLAVEGREQTCAENESTLVELRALIARIKAELATGLELLTGQKPEDDTSVDTLLHKFLLIVHRRIDDILVAFSGDKPEAHDYPNAEAALKELPAHFEILVEVATEGHNTSVRLTEIKEDTALVFERKMTAADTSDKKLAAGNFLREQDPTTAALLIGNWLHAGNAFSTEEYFGPAEEWDETTLQLIAQTACTHSGLGILMMLSDEVLHQKIWPLLNYSVAMNLAKWILSDLQVDELLMQDLNLLMRLTSHSGPEYDFGFSPNYGELTVGILAMVGIVSEDEHPLAKCTRVYSANADAEHAKAFHELLSRTMIATNAAAPCAYSAIPSTEGENDFDSCISGNVHGAMLLYSTANGVEMNFNTTRLSNGASSLHPILRGAVVNKFEHDNDMGNACNVLLAPNGSQCYPYVSSGPLYRIFRAIWEFDGNLAKVIVDNIGSWDVTHDFLNGPDHYRFCLIPICGFAQRENDAQNITQKTLAMTCGKLIARHHKYLVAADKNGKIATGTSSCASRLQDALTQPSRVTPQKV
jgi:hypothetical protein